MNWSIIKSDWGTYCTELHGRWPDLDYGVLKNSGGERRTVVRHMVDVQGGETMSAEIALEDWMHSAAMDDTPYSFLQNRKLAG